MMPNDSACFRPTQPAYPIQIVQDAHMNHPPAPSLRAYRVEHGSILGSRSAGMPLPRTQIHAIKRIGIICWQFLSVEHRASWVVIEEDSFAEFSCLIQCVLLFGFVFVVNNPTITQGGRKMQHTNLGQCSVKKRTPSSRSDTNPHTNRTDENQNDGRTSRTPVIIPPALSPEGTVHPAIPMNIRPVRNRPLDFGKPWKHTRCKSSVQTDFS